jgi:hypothetical protein
MRLVALLIFMLISHGWSSWIGAGVSIGLEGFRETQLVPIVFSGPMFGVYVAGAMTRDSWEWENHLNAHMAYATSRFDQEAVLLGYQVQSMGWKKVGAAWWAGTGIDLQARNAYLYSWDDAHLYWLSSTTMPLGVRYDYSLPQGLHGQLVFQESLGGYVAHRNRFPENKIDSLACLAFHLKTPWRDAQFQPPWAFHSGSLGIRLLTPAKHWAFSIQGDYAYEAQDALDLGLKTLVQYRWML